MQMTFLYDYNYLRCSKQCSNKASGLSVLLTRKSGKREYSRSHSLKSRIDVDSVCRNEPFLVTITKMNNHRNAISLLLIQPVSPLPRPERSLDQLVNRPYLGLVLKGQPNLPPYHLVVRARSIPLGSRRTSKISLPSFYIYSMTFLQYPQIGVG